VKAFFQTVWGRGYVPSVRLLAIILSAALLIFMVSDNTLAAGNSPSIELNTAGVAPRQVEDSTEQAVTRDYAKAWQVMSQAREQNRPDLLNAMFVGTAKDEIAQAIKDQQKTNVRLRCIDHGHNLQAVFYSQEGSALQLRDTAQIETQVLDGGSVVHSETATVHYVVLMTPTSDHWQVRMLQETSGQ
jgi:hypothetical protein